MSRFSYTNVFFIFSLFFWFDQLVCLQPLRVRHIARQNLRSFEWDDKDWSDNFNEYLHQCLDSLKEGQPFQKRKFAFELLTTPLADERYTTECVMDATTWSDLQLLHNEESDFYLGSIVNSAVTELGKTYLICMLAEPTTNIRELQKRQAVIRELVHNE